MLALMAFASAVVTFGFSYVIRRLSLKYKLYPKIRERDVHTRPTPRLGGVAMFFGILATGAVIYIFLWHLGCIRGCQPDSFFSCDLC